MESTCLLLLGSCGATRDRGAAGGFGLAVRLRRDRRVSRTRGDQSAHLLLATRFLDHHPPHDLAEGDGSFCPTSADEGVAPVKKGGESILEASQERDVH